MFGNSTFYTHPKFPFLTIRTGDYDLDGFTDIIFTTIQANQTSRVELWQSVLCTPDICTEPAVAAKRRSFKFVPDNIVLELYQIPNAFAAVFFDLDEDGTNDILVMRDNATKFVIEALFNNISPDAFFFKTLGLNGVCTQWCSGSPAFPDPRPYGVNFHGVTIKYSYSDLNGWIRSPAIPQLPQSSHMPLLTPYTLSGLGRPSNYISYLFLGLPLRSTHWFSWSGIIPNSQVVAIPYPPSSPDSWRAELYLSLSGSTIWIVISIVGCLIVLGVIVFVFSRQEKQQDDKERKEKYHNFKAM